MSGNHPLRAGAAAAILAAAVALTGCGAESSAERAVEKATGADVDIDKDGEEVTVTTEDGEFSTSASLPEGFPTDIPIIDGVVQQGVRSDQDGQQGYLVSVRSDADAKTAGDAVRADLLGAGFEKAAETSAAGYLSMSFERADWQVTAQVIDGDEVQVSYLVVTRE